MLLAFMVIVFLCCFGFIFKECFPAFNSSVESFKKQSSQINKQSDKNTQENTFYCEYSYFTGDVSWKTVGSFSATGIKKNCSYVSAVHNVFFVQRL